MKKVLFHIPFYIDYQLSGGEMTAHDLVKALIENGNEVRILVAVKKDLKNDMIFEVKDGMKQHYQWCDVVITHLGSHGQAYNSAKYFKKRIICYLHNSFRYALIESRKEIEVIYNSSFVYHELRQSYFKNPYIKVRPILYKRFKAINKDAKKVLIINANENKGGKQYLQVLESMPKQKFILIKGGYGEQFIPDLPNVEVIENCKDIEPYVVQCHTLLMLSRYESYGRAAVECILAGMKVVYHYTAEGLKEAVQSGGIEVDRNKIDQVIRAIPKRINIKERQEELINQLNEDKLKFIKFVEQ